MVLWEHRVEETHEPKKVGYSELMGEAVQPGWSARMRPVEVGCPGFVARATVSLHSELGIKGQNLRRAVKNMYLAVEQASEGLWLRRKQEKTATLFC